MYTFSLSDDGSHIQVKRDNALVGIIASDPHEGFCFTPHEGHKIEPVMWEQFTAWCESQMT